MRLFEPRIAGVAGALLSLSLAACLEKSGQVDSTEGTSQERPAPDDSGSQQQPGQAKGVEDSGSPANARQISAQPNTKGQTTDSEALVRAKAKFGALTASDVERYLEEIAPVLIARPVPNEDFDQLRTAPGPSAHIRQILGRWAEGNGFQDTAREFVANLLRVSGQRQGIDYDRPLYLAQKIAREGRPFSELLTADYCPGENGTDSACDSGAPYAAGILSTRAFLAVNNGRFNLERARGIAETFLCRDYPIAQEIQPSVPKAELIPLFQDDQPETPTGDGFGNGFACYTCHSQFASHAQLFVKFDNEGNWQAAASGLQGEDLELGRSPGGTMASHFQDPASAQSERSPYFLGQDVANLAEAARVLVEHPAYNRCMTFQVLRFLTRLQEDVTLSDEALQYLYDDLTLTQTDPSFTDYVVGLLSHPWVVTQFLDAKGGLQ